MTREKMINKLTTIRNKTKNSCIYITLCNYLNTLSSTTDNEYKEVEDFYIETLHKFQKVVFKS